MSSAEQLIDQALADTALTTLVVVDENVDLKQIGQTPDHALTNRYDQYQRARSKGWNCSFSDFVWPKDCKGQFRLIYRISKEKAVIEHLINAAQRFLTTGSEIILIGHKGEGIKTVSKRAQQTLGGIGTEKKISGDLWQANISVNQANQETARADGYEQVKAIATLGDRVLHAKPGLFGWQKLDQGTCLLLDSLPQIIGQPLPLNDRSILDLGCGAGHLLLAAAASNSDMRILATDNNAAALNICQFNLDQANISASVMASDAADSVEGRFDLVLSNPPFHSGFKVDHSLTDKFIKQAARHLVQDGTAVFVVNQHVPVPRIAEQYFKHIELCIDNGSFCVYSLTKPKI